MWYVTVQKWSVKVFPDDCYTLHHGRYSTTEMKFISGESEVKKNKHLKIYLGWMKHNTSNSITFVLISIFQQMKHKNNSWNEKMRPLVFCIYFSTYTPSFSTQFAKDGQVSQSRHEGTPQFVSSSGLTDLSTPSCESYRCPWGVSFSFVKKVEVIRCQVRSVRQVSWDSESQPLNCFHGGLQGVRPSIVMLQQNVLVHPHSS